MPDAAGKKTLLQKLKLVNLFLVVLAGCFIGLFSETYAMPISSSPLVRLTPKNRSNIIGNMSSPRVVLDTNVLVAGLSSNQGASYQLLLRLRKNEFRLLASIPLWLEYESVLKRDEIKRLHGLSHTQVDVFLAGLATFCDPVTLHYLWRPQLTDPDDEMVFETTLNAQADALVTFNVSDFELAAKRFGVNLIKPHVLLEQLKEKMK
jgi:putative PIN family toxin of toxin-antitoxin system